MADAYTGEIRLFAFPRVPNNWHLCDGTALNISDYSALYSVLGTRYGGDGATTFALPDLRGRVPIGQGQGINMTARVLGQKVGSETVAPTQAQLPVHTHVMSAATAVADQSDPTGKFLASTQGINVTATSGGAAKPLNTFQAPATEITQATLNTTAVATAGNGLAHPNVMPSLVLNYMICLNGIYPARP